MKVSYIHHSGFLVETETHYYLFDYEAGELPEMDAEKPILVLSSHSHRDHYNPEVFALLRDRGMAHIRGILSDDIQAPADIDILQVSGGQEYAIGPRQSLHTLRSTDLGVAFLLEDQGKLIYHAGDLNAWVWEEESDSYNEEMTAAYRKELRLLRQVTGQREIDLAFVVLDPRQGKDFHRGLRYFLENIPVKQVYPMHYWDDPSVIHRFIQRHPEYQGKIQATE